MAMQAPRDTRCSVWLWLDISIVNSRLASSRGLATAKPRRWKFCLVCRTNSVSAGNWTRRPRLTLEAPKGGITMEAGA